MLNILLSFVFLTGSSLLFIESFSISGSTKWDILGARFFPQVLLGLAIILSLIILINNFRVHHKRAKQEINNKGNFFSQNKDTFVIFSCVFLFLISLDFLGYFIGTFLFLLVLQWYLSDWKIGKQPIVIAAVATFTIYYMFTKFLNVLFPMGPLDFL